MPTKGYGSGGLSFSYETEAQLALIKQIIPKLMTGGQVEYLASQKRIQEASNALNEANSLYARLTQDPGYRTCCDPTNGPRHTAAYNSALNKIKAAEQVMAQEKQAQAQTQKSQAFFNSAQAVNKSMMTSGQDSPSVMFRPSSSAPNLPLILGLTVGGIAAVIFMFSMMVRK